MLKLSYVFFKYTIYYYKIIIVIIRYYKINW